MSSENVGRFGRVILALILFSGILGRTKNGYVADLYGISFSFSDTYVLIFRLPISRWASSSA